MSDRLCSFLFVCCLLGFQTGCQIGQVAADDSIVGPRPTPENGFSRGDIEQTDETDGADEKIKRLFLDSGLGEGDGFYAELMTFPKERIVAVVKKLREKGLAADEEGYYNESSNENLKIKSAYFLWKLGADRAANEKYIVEAARSKENRHFDALSYLRIMIVEGKKEFLPIIFEYTPEAGGAGAMETYGLFIGELEKSSEIFFRFLSEESPRIRQSVYELVSLKGELYDEKTFEKIMANAKKLRADKKLKNIAEEFLRELDKRQ